MHGSSFLQQQLHTLIGLVLWNRRAEEEQGWHEAATASRTNLESEIQVWTPNAPLIYTCLLSLPQEHTFFIFLATAGY